MTYQLSCYGKPYADVPGFAEAKAAADEHIRACPEGAMDWAYPIRWYEVGIVASRRWVAAAKREWLDHRIDEID